jgi:hypothetical protein
VYVFFFFCPQSIDVRETHNLNPTAVNSMLPRLIKYSYFLQRKERYVFFAIKVSLLSNRVVYLTVSKEYKTVSQIVSNGLKCSLYIPEKK